MSIDGRFLVDVLFHDTAGTNSIKVLSLDSGDSVTTGKVALVTGTIGTATVTFSRAPIPYTAAGGTSVSFALVERVALSGNPHVELTTNASGQKYFASGNRVGVYELTGSERTNTSFAIRTTTGTATYSLLVYGS
jgi:hypothetical protein